MSTPAVFLDKDGTLLVDVPFNADPAVMRLAPGTEAGLRKLARLGLPLIVVTNQPGIARGLLTEADMQVIEDHLGWLFARCGAELDGYYYCPHEEGCECRKPSPGLLQRAAQRHDIALERSWMVGDILDDVEAGARAGCRTILIDNGNETQWRSGPLRAPDFCVPDLDAAASIIEQRMPTRPLHRGAARGDHAERW